MYRIGVDLGGTNIVVGVINENNQIIAKASRRTNAPRAAEGIFDDIAAAISDAMATASITKEDVISVGVGTPGSVNKEAELIEFANNLGFDNVPAYRMLRERTGFEKVYFDNDANCAALGEAVAGCGRGVKDFVMITLGTGVGSGIIANGKLVTGVNYAAGEMGHTVIEFGGVQCNCGRRGCWEQYSSATAVVRQTKDAMRLHPDSLMWDLVNNDFSAVTGRTAFDAARKGDAAAQAVVDKYEAYLACGISNIVNIFQPDMLAVGGGIGNEKEYLLAPVRKILYSERYSIHAKKQTQLVAATLGNDAGVIGAALLDE
ncbi:MAG: ROK family protein [Clostridia bacterium]|nr:ROK family protein [Clostridia bacterium]MBR0510416.1 ROK family protein [Clostridia bacterium]